MLEKLITPQLVATVSQKLVKIALFLIGGETAKRTTAILIKKASFAQKALPKRISSKKVNQQKERLETLRNLVSSTAKIVINFVVFVLILSELGVDILPLLTGAGILGLAVGFGAKSLVSDLIAGFFIILENQFNVGDTIDLGKAGKGKVTQITLRTVKMKDKQGQIHIVPNSNIKYVTVLPKNKI